MQMVMYQWEIMKRKSVVHCTIYHVCQGKRQNNYPETPCTFDDSPTYGRFITAHPNSQWSGTQHFTRHHFRTRHCLSQVSIGDLPVPERIKDSNFTTILWDNFYFGEETLWGKRTTHSTIQYNIIIQRAVDRRTEKQVRQHIRPITKTKKRSFKPPSVILEQYFGTSQNKDGPAFIGQDINIKEDLYTSCPTKTDNILSSFLIDNDTVFR